MSLTVTRTTQGGSARTAVLVLGMLILSILLSLPRSPSLTSQGVDSGVFAYTGQVILHGGLPYRDAWDNKTPGEYYLNALSFVFFGENLWALWLAQILSTWLSALVFWRLLLARPHRGAVALAGTALFVFLACHPILTGSGNFSEIYALLPQVVCFFAGLRLLQTERPAWGLLMGAAAAMAFLTKQNTAGVAVMFPVAVALARPPFLRHPRFLRGGAAIIVGGLLPVACVAGYFAGYGVLADAIDAIFVSPMQFHNWVSHGSTPLWRIPLGTLAAPAVWYSMGPLIPLALIGWILLTREGLGRRGPHSADASSPAPQLTDTVPPDKMRQGAGQAGSRWQDLTKLARLFAALTPEGPDSSARGRMGTSPNAPDPAAATFGLWAALTFAADMVLVNLTGRGSSLGYGHYYLTPVPAFVLLVLTTLERVTFSRSLSRRLKRRVLVYSAAAAVVWLPIVTIRQLARSPGALFGPARLHPMADYVTSHTAPTDPVLVWGASSRLNFQARRRSPTRFHYGYYLVPVGEPARNRIAELVRDLEMNRPVMIVDTAMDDGKHIPPLDPIQRQEWEANGGRHDVEDLTPVYDFIARHCAQTEPFGKFQVYHCAYAPLPPESAPRQR